MNGEKPSGKNPTGWFSCHHFRNSTIITTSGYKQGIPSTFLIYSWTFIPIPNRICSVVTVPLSDARLPSTWLTVVQIPVCDFKTPTERIVLRVVKQYISCKNFEQIVTGDEVLALVHLFLLKKLLCICTVWFCDQTFSWSSSCGWTEELCSWQSS